MDALQADLPGDATFVLLMDGQGLRSLAPDADPWVRRWLEAQAWMERAPAAAVTLREAARVFDTMQLWMQIQPDGVRTSLEVSPSIPGVLEALYDVPGQTAFLQTEGDRLVWQSGPALPESGDLPIGAPATAPPWIACLPEGEAALLLLVGWRPGLPTGAGGDAPSPTQGCLGLSRMPDSSLTFQLSGTGESNSQAEALDAWARRVLDRAALHPAARMGGIQGVLQSAIVERTEREVAIRISVPEDRWQDWISLAQQLVESETR
jgi:hypothetical protein